MEVLNFLCLLPTTLFTSLFASIAVEEIPMCKPIATAYHLHGPSSLIKQLYGGSLGQCIWTVDDGATLKGTLQCGTSIGWTRSSMPTIPGLACTGNVGLLGTSSTTSGWGLPWTPPCPLPHSTKSAMQYSCQNVSFRSRPLPHLLPCLLSLILVSINHFVARGPTFGALCQSNCCLPWLQPHESALDSHWVVGVCIGFYIAYKWLPMPWVGSFSLIPLFGDSCSKWMLGPDWDFCLVDLYPVGQIGASLPIWEEKGLLFPALGPPSFQSFPLPMISAKRKAWMPTLTLIHTFPFMG